MAIRRGIRIGAPVRNRLWPSGNRWYWLGERKFGLLGRSGQPELLGRRMWKGLLWRRILLLRAPLGLLAGPLVLALLQIEALRLALELAHMLVEGGTQIARRAPELCHPAPQIARQFRQFLRPEYDQSDQKNEYQVRNTEHRGGISTCECIIE